MGIPARWAAAAAFSLLVLLGGCSDSSTNEAEKPRALTPEGKKLRVAVISHSDFVPDRTRTLKASSIGLPEPLAERISEHLVSSGRFVPVERKSLRRVVTEQRFGQELQKTYLDRTLDKAIGEMTEIEGGSVKGASVEMKGPKGIGMEKTSPVEPRPVGEGIEEGTGPAGTTGVLADYNDILKNFQDLGTAVGADYIVLGNLEKLEQKSEKIAVPYRSEKKTVQEKSSDARLRIRIIDVQSGTVVGADSLRTTVKDLLFEGEKTDSDDFSFFDHLGRLAAVKVLDIAFPARIVSRDPLVLSRGSNDGVKAGDMYVVRREGKEIKDETGILIGRLQTEVGRVQVVAPQETVSTVKPVTGEGFTVSDLATLDFQFGESGKSAGSPGEVQLYGSDRERLPRLAVGLVKSGSTARTGPKAAEHTPLFTDTLISRLTQSRRFVLIDRQEVDQLLDEQFAQALSEGRGMASALGTLKGADYLAYGSLAHFGVEEQTTQLPNSSRTFKRKIGYVEGNMRLVDVKSGEILASRQVMVRRPVDASADGGRIANDLATAYAEQVTLLLMNEVYPVKVAAIGNDGTIYINRGDDGGLFIGETLEVFRPGPPVRDPDTGVQLGVEETFVAQVRVNEVEGARSKGVVAAGDGVQVGDILKRTLPNRGARSASAAPRTGSRSGAGLPGSPPGVKERQRGAKATLAVGTIKLNPGARANTIGEGHLKRMTDDFITKLSNTNRFVVMERQEVDQILDEKGFDAMTSGGDIYDRLRELGSADYVIHGEVANFYVVTEEMQVPYVDEKQKRMESFIEGTVRIVDVHSGAVVAADKVRESKPVKKGGDSVQITSEMLDRFTTNAVSGVVGRLFPIRVLEVTPEGTVYINRGEDGGLRRGVVYDVMRPGEDMIDPDTGLSFGKAETRVAKVEIAFVEAYRAQASATSGEKIKVGDILRRPVPASKKQKSKVIQPNW